MQTYTNTNRHGYKQSDRPSRHRPKTDTNRHRDTVRQTAIKPDKTDRHGQMDKSDRHGQMDKSDTDRWTDGQVRQTRTDGQVSPTRLIDQMDTDPDPGGLFVATLSPMRVSGLFGTSLNPLWVGGLLGHHQILCG